MKNIELATDRHLYSQAHPGGRGPMPDSLSNNPFAPQERHDLDIERATLVHVTRQLRLALHDAWSRAQQQSTPETYLAATLQFSDLDMIRCLEAATRLYRKSLSQVAAAIVAWKSAFKQVSAEIVEELQIYDVPVEGVYRMIQGQSWHHESASDKDQKQQNNLNCLRQGSSYLAQLLEQLQRVEDALGHDRHHRLAYR